MKNKHFLYPAIFLIQFSFFGITPCWSEDPFSAVDRLEKQGKLEEAFSLLKKDFESNPTEESFKRGGILLKKQKKFPEAEKLLSEGLVRFPKSVFLLNHRALILHKMGKIGPAVADWKRVLALEPSNSIARNSLEKFGRSGETPANTRPATVFKNSPPTRLGTELSIPQQEEIAEKLFGELTRTDKWELDAFSNSYKEVMRRCPDTEWAEIACWRLSNLYLTAYEQPDFAGVIETLEHFVSRYPRNVLYGEAKERLLIAYKGTGDWQKVAEMYEEIFRMNPEPTPGDSIKWSLEYGNALSRLGEISKARQYLENVVKMDENRDSLEGRAARALLSELK